jgi:hypothetical protein
MNAYLGKPDELREVGVRALQDALGDETALEFLKLWRGTPGADFNKWLNEQPQKSADEIEAEIMRIQARIATPVSA